MSDDHIDIPPVVAVILLVAITIILAAVIGFYVIPSDAEDPCTTIENVSAQSDGSIYIQFSEEYGGDLTITEPDNDTVAVDASGDAYLTVPTDVESGANVTIRMFTDPEPNDATTGESWHNCGGYTV